jgi:hypothetical protein
VFIELQKCLQAESPSLHRVARKLPYSPTLANTTLFCESVWGGWRWRELKLDEAREDTQASYGGLYSRGYPLFLELWTSLMVKGLARVVGRVSVDIFRFTFYKPHACQLTLPTNFSFPFLF